MTRNDQENTSIQQIAASNGLRTALALLPYGQLAMIAGAVVIYALFSTDETDYPLTLWLAGISLLALAWITLSWWDQRPSASLGRTTTLRHTLLAALVSGAMGLGLYWIFPRAQSLDAVFIACYGIATLTSGAFAFSTAPLVALAWILPLGVFAFLALFLAGSPNFPALFGMGLLYTGYVVGAIFQVAWLARERETLQARDQAKARRLSEQNAMIELLLREFEENAEDWLWETDAQVRLTHVSPRIGKLLQKDPGYLLHADVIASLTSADPQISAEDQATLEQFRERFSQPHPFKDQQLHAYIGGQYRWWSFSGAPLLAEDGSIQGWRGVGRDITKSKQAAEELNWQANYDNLTGLPNRYQFKKRLSSSFEQGEARPSLFLHLHIENFKNINAIFGHNAGDRILQESAQRLLAVARRPDTLLARLGGADFGFFCPQGEDPAAPFIESLLNGLRQPIWIAYESIAVDLKAGIVLDAQSYKNTDTLLQNAEVALLSAKQALSTSHAYFNRKLAEKNLWQLGLINDMASAVKNHEIRAFYQPQVCARTRRLLGAEALIRWNNPRLGLVSPAEFIPLAEKNGHILPFGYWMLERACMDALQWDESVKVSVNVSAVQLLDSELFNKVMLVLQRTGLPTARLKIEITESAFIGNSDNVKQVLLRLRSQGIAISLDDFGTGYSSLSYLCKFPIDELKIDQSFVRTLITDKDSRSIVRSIVRLAQDMALKTTAEGVESEEQARMLTELGCDVFQGYLFGKPQPQEELYAWALHPNQV